MWIFVLVLSAILFWDGGDYIAGGPFGASLLLFIIAIIVSAVMISTNR